MIVVFISMQRQQIELCVLAAASKKNQDGDQPEDHQDQDEKCKEQVRSKRRKAVHLGGKERFDGCLVGWVRGGCVNVLWRGS